MSNAVVRKKVIRAGYLKQDYWQEIWSYRELLYFLVWRDILVRFKQTFLGVAWVLIRPITSVLVFTIVFGKVARLDSGGVPYPLLVFAGTLIWQFSAGSLGACTGSLLQNANLVKKVYFPRLILLFSSIAVNFVDFLIAGVVFLGILVFYNVVPNWHILTLPIFILMAAAIAFGGGLWLGSLSVKYRDFKQIVPYIVQVGQYISPVGFSSDVIPEKWRFVYSMNPLVGVIDGFRWAVLGADVTIFIPGFIMSLVITCVLVFSGLRYFRKVEQSFADNI